MSANRLTSPIPTDTKEALKLHNWQIDNIALLLNKYLDFLMIESINYIDNNSCNAENSVVVKIDGMHYKIKEINKNTQIKNINFFPLVRREQIPENVEENLLEKILDNSKLDKSYINRFKNSLKNYRRCMLAFISNGEIGGLINRIICRQKQIADNTFELKTKTRLVVGLGSGSVLETSIKLHHIYGVPYIPASAIKGVLRAYKIWELTEWDDYKFLVVEELIESYEDKKFEKQKNDLMRKINNDKLNKKFKEVNPSLSEEELKKIKNELLEYLKKIKKEQVEKLIKIFGNQQQKGKLIVLDAYPTNFEGFDVDIMNPHFPDYYEEGKNEPPADWQNPNPITFLTIPEETTFKFFFRNPYNNLEENLKSAFEYLGIGAKTSIGYGILE